MRGIAEYLASLGVVAYSCAYTADGNLYRCADEALNEFDLIQKCHRGLGIDPNQMFVCGVSAGAQLACFVASKREVGAVVAICPVLDLKEFHEWDISDQFQEELNPIEMLTVNDPVLCVAGSKDTVAPVSVVAKFVGQEGGRSIRVLDGGHDCYVKDTQWQEDSLFPFLDDLRLCTETRRDTWHRTAVGGNWEMHGGIIANFLIDRGLRPDQTVVDYGCGPMRVGRHLVSYLETGKYIGIDQNERYLAEAQKECHGSFQLHLSDEPIPKVMQEADVLLCHGVGYWSMSSPIELVKSIAWSCKGIPVYFSFQDVDVAFNDPDLPDIVCTGHDNNWYFRSRVFEGPHSRVLAEERLVDLGNYTMVTIHND